MIILKAIELNPNYAEAYEARAKLYLDFLKNEEQYKSEMAKAESIRNS